MKILTLFSIVLLSVMLVSARVIKYDHNLEFVKYEIDEANNDEEDHLSVKIYNIGAMESKFNKLSDELRKQQQHIFDKYKMSSEKALEKFNEDTQEINNNLMNINNWVKENLNEFENIKNDMEVKKLNITKDYMNEILTYENNQKLNELLCKNSTDQLNMEKKFLTNLLNECSQCNADRIKDLNREIQIVEENLKRETEHCKDSVQFLRESINLRKSKMTDALISLYAIRNYKFETIIEKFYNLAKLEKLSNDSVQLKAKYFSEKEQIESNLQSKLSNLNEMLTFDSIKPKSGEGTYNTNKKELKSEVFLQDFLTITNGKEYQQHSHVTQSLHVEEPLYVKWEKIHEKTTFIPENSVIAGYDIDGSILYVVRACNGNKCTYGKYARSKSRRNAYIPYENAEKGVEEIELLTTPNYEWCSFDMNKSYDNLPVCRVEYKNSIIPGTLQRDGMCRIGYGWEIILLVNNIEVLGITGC